MKKIILLLMSCFILTSCAGLADYSISLENGYEIVRSSSHQVSILGDEPVKSDNAAIANYFYVEAKVTDIWWNDDYIVAKQLHLQPNEYGTKHPPDNPTEADWSYWMINIDEHEVTGPLLLTELQQIAKQLDLDIQFTSIERLKRKVS